MVKCLIFQHYILVLNVLELTLDF